MEGHLTISKKNKFWKKKTGELKLEGPIIKQMIDLNAGNYKIDKLIHWELI